MRRLNNRRHSWLAYGADCFFWHFSLPLCSSFAGVLIMLTALRDNMGAACFPCEIPQRIARRLADTWDRVDIQKRTRVPGVIMSKPLCSKAYDYAS
jgi:hypothetical protein